MTKRVCREIIIVDDEPIALFILTKMLQKLYPDLKVEAYTHSSKILSLIEERGTHQVIFMDLTMPSLSGWDLLEAMNGHGYGGEVVILTSSVNIEDRERAMAFANVKGYLVKPVTLDELQGQLESLDGLKLVE
ncbi:MAG: response regulator [Flavobacteriales bacterium]